MSLSLADLTDRLYASIALANEPRVYEHWHASELAKCPRAQYFTRQGVPTLTQPTAAKMLRWSAGHLIEEVIRPHLQAIYPDLQSNIRFTSEKMDLTGELDNYSEKEKTIIEIKSVGPRAVKNKRVGETRFHLRDEQPYLGHRYQEHGYVLLLEEAKLPVERIIYVYITLEGLIVIYDEQVDQEIITNINKRLSLLNEATDDNLPPCFCQEDHPLWKSSTQFCDYRAGDMCCDPELLKKKKEPQVSLVKESA